MGDAGRDDSLRRTAALAGLMFLASLLVPLLNFVLVFTRLYVANDVVATAANVAAHPSLFRVHVVAELATSIIVVVLGVALFTMLESVHRLLALLALLLKLVEAALWAVLALAHLAALRALTGGASSQDRVWPLVGLLLDAHMPLTAIPGMFLGLASVAFLHLLVRSRYVPGALAAFGVVSFALLFLYDLTLVVAPGYAAMTPVQVVGWGPSVLFELAIGPWLLVKGVAVPPSASPSS